MVTHATVLALVMLKNGSADSYVGGPVSACCWEPLDMSRGTFGARAVEELLMGDHVPLPTCPDCAVLVDLALESR